MTEIVETAFGTPIDASPKKVHINGNATQMYPDLDKDCVKSMTVVDELEIEQPIDMSWPHTFCKQCTYIALAPIMWPLYLTLPDVKKPVRVYKISSSFYLSNFRTEKSL